jgi:mannose-1-phosphate guanylyltransferase
VTVPRQALVLAAGLGLRLRPLTLVRAKPAIPVGGVPLVRNIVSRLASAGVRDVVVNLHHLPASLTRVLGEGADLGVRVRYSWERPLVLGTAGGPRQALDILRAEELLVLNGDTITDVGLSALADSYVASGALVTLALVPNREPCRYGGVILDTDSRVTGFVPRGPAAEGSFHFLGVQIASAHAFDLVAPGQPTNSIGDVYDRVVAKQPGAISGFVCEAAFHDIGTVADYIETCRQLADGTDPICGASVHIHPTAFVSRSILWDDIEVQSSARLEECIVTDGVRVPSGASHSRAILRRDEAGSTIAIPLETLQ